MRRRVLLAALAAAVLPAAALPSAAGAAYDLTVSDAPTSGATVTTGAGATRVRATAPGANVNVAALTASLERGTNVMVLPDAAGTEAGDVTVAAALSSSGAGQVLIDRTVPGTTRVRAAVAVDALLVESAGGAVIDAPRVTVGTALQVTGPTVLRRDVTIDGRGTAFLRGGVAGPHALTLSSPLSSIDGSFGTTAAPLASVRTSGDAQLNGSVVTTGDQTYGGATWITAHARLTSTAGTVRFTGALEDTEAVNTGRDLAVDAAREVRLEGPVGAARPLRSLSLTAPAIALPAGVRTRGAQTYVGAVAVGTSTLAGARVEVVGSVGLMPAATLTVAAGTGATLDGPLRGTAGAAARLTGAGDAVLTGATNADAAPVTLAGAGRTEVRGDRSTTAVRLADGTLGGDGALGPVVATGGTLDPGRELGGARARGALRLAALDATAGVTLRFDGVAGAAPFETLRVDGPVALDGATLDVPQTGGPSVPPGGSVTLIDHGGSAPIAGDFAGRPEGALVPVGGADLVLSYAGGDGTDVTLTRPRQAATLTLTAEPATSVQGHAVRFVATLAPATASGRVTFRDADGALLGSADVSDSTATLTTSTLPTGVHEVTAEYAGDGATLPAVSAPVRHLVLAPPPAGGGDGGTGGPPPVGGGPGGASEPPPGGSGAPDGTPQAPPLRPSPPPPPATPDGAAVRRGLRAVADVRGTAGRLTLRQRFAVGGRVRWTLTVRGRRTVLAARTATVGAGPRTVTLRLGVRGRRLLRRAGTARLTLRTTLSPATGSPATVTTTLRRPRGLR